MLVYSTELAQSFVKVLNLVGVRLETAPFRHCFLDPLPTDLQPFLYVLLLGLLCLNTEPLHHCKELRDETSNPARELDHVLLDYVEFFELR